MTISGKQSAISDEARCSGRLVSVTARSIIVSLALVTLVAIMQVAMKGPAVPMPSPSFASRSIEPKSPEARVSDATSHLGLGLMKAMSLKTTASTTADQNQQQDNTVVSPLSLQILLNMILLGTNDQSLSQAELAKVLGYDTETSGAGELSLRAGESEDADNASARLGRPHEAMHSVVDSIMKATRSSVDDRHLPNTGQALVTGEASSSDNYQQGHRRSQAHSQATTREFPLNFTLANLMLSNKDLVKMNPEYQNELNRYYDIQAEQFSRRQDFVWGDGKKLKLHERINNWVENITQNQITNLADEKSMSNLDLILVLVNAAYFKGRWLNTFEPESTRDRIFYNNGQSSAGVETKFMHQTDGFGYAEFEQKKEKLAPKIELSNEERRRLELTANISCRALSLPFLLNDGQEMSMVVLLPSKRDGLDELIENLNVEVLNEIYRSLSNQEVQVSLPKFKIEATHDGKAMLRKLGLERIFDVTAELDRMFVPTVMIPPYVGAITHKAKITVDEQGAEAAAASMAEFFGSIQGFERKTPPAFVADHPFLYIIRHNRFNMPLFMGQVRSFQTV